jgi:hypothetical protein
MKILALERELPGFIAADFQPYLHGEAKRVWELYQQGIVREIYFAPGSVARAVLMLEAATEAEALADLATLPLVEAGLISFDLLPLVPYPGWGRLFAAE